MLSSIQNDEESLVKFATQPGDLISLLMSCMSSSCSAKIYALSGISTLSLAEANCHKIFNSKIPGRGNFVRHLSSTLHNPSPAALQILTNLSRCDKMRRDAIGSIPGLLSVLVSHLETRGNNLSLHSTNLLTSLAADQKFALKILKEESLLPHLAFTIRNEFSEWKASLQLVAALSRVGGCRLAIYSAGISNQVIRILERGMRQDHPDSARHAAEILQNLAEHPVVRVNIKMIDEITNHLVGIGQSQDDDDDLKRAAEAALAKIFS